MRKELKSPLVLIINYEIRSTAEIGKILNTLTKYNEPVFLIGKYFSSQVTSQIVYYYKRKLLNVLFYIKFID